MEFEPHRRPNESALEQFRSDIAAMRSQNWPYGRIASWLATEKYLTMHNDSIRRFCIRRGITKGKKSPPASLKQSVRSKPKKLFEYDDSKPIETRRNR